jgi:hypothetical protein
MKRIFKVDWKEQEEKIMKLVEEEKKMSKKSNLIEIDWKEERNGKITIVAVHNMLSGIEILKKYGETVHYRYGKSRQRVSFNTVLSIYECKSHPELCLRGRKFPITMIKEKFLDLVAYYQEAGDQLVAIRNQYRKEVSETKVETRDAAIQKTYI